VAAEREHLDARQAELDAACHSSDQQRQQWQTERDEAQRQWEEQRNELTTRLADLEAQKNALAETRQQWEAQHNENASQVAAEREHLDARQAELDADHHSLDQQRQQWQVEHDEAQRQWGEQRNELTRRLADLEAQRSVFEADRRQWEQQRAELARTAEQPSAACEPVAEVACPDEVARQEPEFETPSEGAPVDLADVFRRVGAKVDLDEDASSTPSMEVDQSEGPRGDRQSPPAAPEEHGGEESIDDYMSRLMQRVRSKSDDPGRAPYMPQRSESQSARQSQADAAMAPSVDLPPVVARPTVAARKPVEMSRRSAAPESRVDLSALRELANFSARSAVSRHSRKLLINTMRSKLVMAIMALAAGGGLFWMWQRYGAVEMTLYYSLAAVLVAVYFGVQYALLTGRLRINELGHINIAWDSFTGGKPATPAVEDDTAEDSPETVAVDAPPAAATPADAHPADAVPSEETVAQPVAEDASHGE
jgi:chemotaxis protein histidine kinase CheA